MITLLRSIVGRFRPEELEEPVLEDSEAPSEEAGPLLILLVSIGGVLSYHMHAFSDADSAAEFIGSRFPPGMKQAVFAFWALQKEPDQIPEAGLRDTVDAVLLIRDPARPGIVDLISCVDMKSALSLARGEVESGLDLSLIMLYWAVPVTMQVDEEGALRLSPAQPPTVSPAPTVAVAPEATLTLPAETTAVEPAAEEEPEPAQEAPFAPELEEVEPGPAAEPTAVEPAAEEEPVLWQEAPFAPEAGEVEPGPAAEPTAVQPVAEEEPAAAEVAEKAAATLKVMIVDPDDTSRAELLNLLEPSNVVVVGETRFGKEAMDMATRLTPDIVMVAMEEPVARTTRMIAFLGDSVPHLPIIVYSSLKDANCIRQAMLAGVKDYLVTPMKQEELLSSMRTVRSQEERRQQRLSGEVKGPATAGEVITVFGAKGGIGKTTIATNLATAIAGGTRESVVLVDLDPRFGDVGILLDISAERSIADLAIPAEEITKELIMDCLHIHPSGVAMLPAPARPTDWRKIEARQIERVVTVLAQTFDYVILDTPGTFNEVVIRALELADIAILVTTSHVTSLKDTQLAITMLRSWSFDDDRIRLVVNATNDAVGALPPQIEEQLGIQAFWSIPYDPNIPLAAQLGTAVVLAKASSAAGQALTEMALALSGARDYRRQQPEEEWQGGVMGGVLSKPRSGADG